MVIVIGIVIEIGTVIVMVIGMINDNDKYNNYRYNCVPWFGSNLPPFKLCPETPGIFMNDV